MKSTITDWVKNLFRTFFCNLWSIVALHWVLTTSLHCLLPHSTDVIIMWYSMHIGHGNQTNERFLRGSKKWWCDFFHYNHLGMFRRMIVQRYKIAANWKKFSLHEYFHLVHVMETNYFSQPKRNFFWNLKLVLIYCERWKKNLSILARPST